MSVLLHDIISFLAVKCLISMPGRGQAKQFWYIQIRSFYLYTKHHYPTSCTCLIKREILRWSTGSSLSIRVPRGTQCVPITTTSHINVVGLHVVCCFALILTKIGKCRQISVKKTAMKFQEIHPVVVALLHANRRTDMTSGSKLLGVLCAKCMTQTHTGQTVSVTDVQYRSICKLDKIP